MCGDEGIYGKSLYHLLNFALNLKIKSNEIYQQKI